MIDWRVILVLLVSIGACREVAACRSGPPPTVKELVEGGRIAARGTLLWNDDGRGTADLHIEEVLVAEDPSRSVKAGDIIRLSLHPSWMYDAPDGRRAIWILG